MQSAINNFKGALFSVIDLKYNSIKDTLVNQIEPLINEYINKIQSYTQGQDLLEGITNCPRKDLIADIIACSSVLQTLQHKTPLSNLLFGDRDYLTHVFFDDIKFRPKPVTLFSMRLRISQWTTTMFKNEHLTIDEYTLEKLKRDALSTIEIFMVDYEGDPFISHRRPKSGRLYSRGALEQKFRFVYACWAAAAVYTNNPTISSRAASQVFKLGDLNRPLSRGADFNAESLKKILLILNNMAAEESVNIVPMMEAIPIPLSEKLDIYNIALEELSKYKEMAGIHFIKHKARAFYDRVHWFEEATKCYHITTSMEKYLGFDWLFFVPLDDDIFKERGFRRHHFRDDPDRKMSLYVSDLFLTTQSMMNMWESLTEAESITIMDAARKLISIEKDITKSDIDNLFGANEWLYENVIKNIGIKTSMFLKIG